MLAFVAFPKIPPCARFEPRHQTGQQGRHSCQHHGELLRPEPAYQRGSARENRRRCSDQVVDAHPATAILPVRVLVCARSVANVEQLVADASSSTVTDVLLTLGLVASIT